jgi:hypothetical protein
MYAIQERAHALLKPPPKQHRMPSLRTQYHRGNVIKFQFGPIHHTVKQQIEMIVGMMGSQAPHHFIGEPANALELSGQQQTRVYNDFQGMRA